MLTSFSCTASFKVKPIFNQLNAEDLSNIENGCFELKNTLSDFDESRHRIGAAATMIKAVVTLINTVGQALQTYTRKGAEVHGGASFIKVRRMKKKSKMKTAPTPFSSVFAGIDKKYMLSLNSK